MELYSTRRCAQQHSLDGQREMTPQLLTNGTGPTSRRRITIHDRKSMRRVLRANRFYHFEPCSKRAGGWKHTWRVRVCERAASNRYGRVE